MESSIFEQIILDCQGSSCSLVRHADLCCAPCGVVLWAGPPLVAQPMWSLAGTRGHTPIGPYPPYIARGGRVTGQLFLSSSVYMTGNIEIAKSSIFEQIILDRQGSSRSLTRHANLHLAPRGVVFWAGPPLAARPMYSPVGIGGYTPTAGGDSPVLPL